MAEITSYKIQVNSCKENIANIEMNIQNLLKEKEELLDNITCKNKEKEKTKNEIELIKEENYRYTQFSSF